jgi:hypothetical protein
MNVAAVFEDELRRRGIALAIDAESGRQTIEIDGWSTLISLQNLQRDVDRDGDLERVPGSLTPSGRRARACGTITGFVGVVGTFTRVRCATLGFGV